jgi:hypothetical protein
VRAVTLSPSDEIRLEGEAPAVPTPRGGTRRGGGPGGGGGEGAAFDFIEITPAH